MMAPHEYHLRVPSSAIDANGHVNNVEYLRWMQEAAISHADAVGCTEATLAAGASWVVRTHHVEYLRPAYAGEELIILTWVATVKTASSVRNYLIVREKDGTLLARGETNWVFIDAAKGRPRSIPPTVAECFTLVPPDKVPSEKEFLAAIKPRRLPPAP